MRARFGGFGAEPLADSATNASSTSIVAHRVEAPLEADRGRASRAHRLAAERAGDVAREHLDAVGQLEQPPQRVEEARGALAALDREVGPGRVADEERVAREHEPRLVGARRVDDGEAAVLGPVARRVDRADPRPFPTASSSPSSERVVRVLDLGGGVDAHRDAVLEREAAVPGDVVGVRVGLERADDSHVEPLGLREDALDRERRIDDHRLAGLLAADEVRGTAEIVVHELREEHGGGR